MLRDDNPKTSAGQFKPVTFFTPTTATLALGEVMRRGSEKYGSHNWRRSKVSVSTYMDAIERHLIEYKEGINADLESGLHPLAHVMACCAILIDADACFMLNDDRPGATMVNNAPGIIEVMNRLTMLNEERAPPEKPKRGVRAVPTRGFDEEEYEGEPADD